MGDPWPYDPHKEARIMLERSRAGRFNTAQQQDRNTPSSQRPAAGLRIWGHYLPSQPYRHRPHLGFPNCWECTKRSDYLPSALSGVARGAYCQARGAHRRILGVMTLVHFPQAQDSHPTGHVPPIGAAVEAFFVHRDLAPNSRRAYRAAGGGCRCRPAVGGAHLRRRGWGVHRTVGWCCAGDVEHPAGGGAGVCVLVRGPLAPRRGSARRCRPTPPAHRPARPGSATAPPQPCSAATPEGGPSTSCPTRR